MPAEPPPPLRHPHAGGIGPPQGTPVPPLGFRGHLESTAFRGLAPRGLTAAQRPPITTLSHRPWRARGSGALPMVSAHYCPRWAVSAYLSGGCQGPWWPPVSLS